MLLYLWHASSGRNENGCDFVLFSPLIQKSQPSEHSCCFLNSRPTHLFLLPEIPELPLPRKKYNPQFVVDTKIAH